MTSDPRSPRKPAQDPTCAPSDLRLYQILRTQPRKRSSHNVLTCGNAGAQGAPPKGCCKPAHLRGLASLAQAIEELWADLITTCPWADEHEVGA